MTIQTIAEVMATLEEKGIIRHMPSKKNKSLTPGQPFHTIYLDMDGVIADYYSLINSYTNEKSPKGKYMRLIREGGFIALKEMPFSQGLLANLIEYQFEWPGVEIEILSSLGVYDHALSEAVKSQKNAWLDSYKYHGNSNFHVVADWKRNFTFCGEEKAMYAEPGTLLIDDTKHNCTNFEWNGGKSIHYTAASSSLLEVQYTLNLVERPKVAMKEEDNWEKNSLTIDDFFKELIEEQKQKEEVDKKKIEIERQLKEKEEMKRKDDFKDMLKLWSGKF